MIKSNLARAKEAARRVREHDAKAEEWAKRRDAAMFAALKDDGIPVGIVADACGMSHVSVIKARVRMEQATGTTAPRRRPNRRSTT